MLEEEDIFIIVDLRYSISNFHFKYIPSLIIVTIFSIAFDFLISISPLRRTKLVKIFVLLTREG